MLEELKELEQLKRFLDSELFMTFVLLGAKSEKQFKRIANSYLIRYIIYLRHRKAFIK